ERVRKNDGAAEMTFLQEPDAFARVSVPGDDAAGDSGRRQQRGNVVRCGHRDAAFPTEPVLQRAVRGQSKDVVPHPVETNHDCLTTAHLVVRFLPSLSSDRASITT